MKSLTVAKKRVFVSALVLFLIAGAVLISGWRHTPIFDQVKNYADNSGFNEFLDLYESDSGEDSGISAEERVSDYLGDSDILDPYEDRPLVSDTDPDLAEEIREKTGEFPEYATAASVSKWTQPTSSLTKYASIAETAAAKKQPGKSPYKQSSNAGSFAVENSSVKRPGIGKDVAILPENEYPDIPRPTKTNLRVPLSFRIYSHNVKNGMHNELEPGEVPWEARKQLVINSIKQHAQANTIVLLQEPLKFQVNDIMAGLNLFAAPDSPEWVYYGLGRVDGADIGEHVPIIVRVAEWEIVYNDTFWLNENNPRGAYLGWDAKYQRIVSYVTLRHQSSGQYINVANTHFDHKGSVAREESALLVSEKMSSLNQWPSFIAGDFNAPPDDGSVKNLAKKFVDVHSLVPAFNRYGHPDYSYTGFSGKYLQEAKRIDYIFAPPYTRKLSEPACNAASRVVSLQLAGYGLLHSKYGGVYMSDHRPVVADFIMRGCA